MAQDIFDKLGSSLSVEEREEEQDVFDVAERAIASQKPFSEEKPKDIFDTLGAEEEEKTDLNAGQIAGSMAIDIAGGIGSAAAGSAIAAGKLARSLPNPLAKGIGVGLIGIGGMASNYFAQRLAENRDHEEIQWGRTLSSGALNYIPGSEATKFARPIVREAGKGLAAGVADVALTTAIDEERFPTAAELGIGALFGSTIGAAGGAVTKKVQEGFGAIYGMTYSDIDKILLQKGKDGKAVRELLELADPETEWTPAKIASSYAALQERQLLQKTKNKNQKITEGWEDTLSLFGKINPTLALGNEVTLNVNRFKAELNAINSQTKKLPKDIQEGLQGKKNTPLYRELGEDVEAYLRGADMSAKLNQQRWKASLEKYREIEDELYEKLGQALANKGHFQSFFLKDLNKSQRDFFRVKIERAIKDRRYRARQFKALIPGAKEFAGSKKEYKLLGEEELLATRTAGGSNLYKDLKDEILDWQIKNNPLVVTDDQKKLTNELKKKMSKKDRESLPKQISITELKKKDGLIDKHIKSLITRNQKGGTQKLENILPGNVEQVLKNHVPGKIEAKWLGEVKEVGFKMRNATNLLGKTLAKYESEINIFNALQKVGLATTKRGGQFNSRISSFSHIDADGVKFFTTEEINDALSLFYSAPFQKQVENELLGILDTSYKSLEVLAKSAKVVFNTPSYAVNFIGSNLSMLGMGMLPTRIGKDFKSYFDNLSKGLQQSRMIEKAVDAVTNKSAKAKKDFIDEIFELQKLGVLDPEVSGNVYADDILQTLQSGKFSKSIKSGYEFVGKLYSASDVAARISVYEHNIKQLSDIFPNMAGSDKLKRAAAEFTNDTYQNYARVSRIIRGLSRYGVMPQFVTFTAELSRNVYHQTKSAIAMMNGTFGKRYGLDQIDIDGADLQKMRSAGAVRLASLAAVTFGLGKFSVDAWNRSQGVDKEKDNYFRKILPSYNKNKQLAYRIDENNPNRISVLNASYIVPQAIIASVFEAALADENDERSIIGLLADEFMGEGTFFQVSLYEGIQNRDKYGEKITRRTEPEQRAYDIVMHVINQSFTFGTYREIERLEDAIRQEEQGVDPKAIQKVIQRQFGFRYIDTELDRNINFQLQDLTDTQSEAKGEFTKALRYDLPEGKITNEELLSIYQRSNETSKEAYEKMKDLYISTVQNSGLSSEQIEEIFTSPRSNLSTKNKVRIINNLEYEEFEPALTLSNEEQYEQMFGEGTDIANFSDEEVKSQIRELRKTDPLKSEKFRKMYIQRKKVDKQRLSTNYKLLKKLSVVDRARMILDLGLDTPSELKELRRAGIYTESVKMAIDLELGQ